MTTIMAFVKSRRVLTYFILTFALSWGSWLLFASGAPMRSDPRFMLTILAAPIAPAVVGLLMIGLTAGRAGYHELLARLFRWRVAVGWYAIALLLAPLVAIMTALLLAQLLHSPEFFPTIFTTQDPVGLLLPGLITGLLVGVCEEFGWTGFAIPHLRLHYSILATGLGLGVVWGAWHFPLFWRNDSFAGTFPLVLLLAQLFAWLPAYRVLMVWVYDHTGSLLIAMLMHVSLTATSVIFAGNVSDAQLLISVLVSAGVWWLIVTVFAVANRRHLPKQPLRRRVAR